MARIHTMYKTISIIIILLAIIVLAYNVPKPKQVESANIEVRIIREGKVEDVKEYARQQVLDRFGEGQWSSFYFIIQKESNWTHTAKNPISSSFGLCQTMMSLYEDDTKDDFRTNPYTQIDWCLDYAAERYGDPKNAKVFWEENRYW